MKTVLIIAAVAIVLVLVLAFVIRRKRAARQSLTALVFLMSKPHPLTEERVRDAIAKVWGIRLGSEMQPGGDWLVDSARVNPAMAQPGTSNFLVSANGRMFLINSVSRPYMDNPEQFAASIPELRLRRAVGGHVAWNSVDLFGNPPAREEKPEVYAALGTLLAEFANDDCLVIFCPELGRCNEYAPSVLEALKSGATLELFEAPTHVPIVQVASDDPRMLAAVAEAQRRWPEFVAAFQANPNPELPFAVKARFVDGENEEFMWVRVRKIEGDAVTGQLDNCPAELRNVKEGDTVTVAPGDVNDWYYATGGEPVGGFTMKVMEQVMQGEKP